ncbi:ESPR-type extended signal peptide-containing protein, partial [Paraburkholderia atlantica]|uniref:ESPR-type extended signal peptide-containing protein n=1 Tax=Paraburkholderia atlantica TaxID=2654982 RepID=UPI0021A8E536
MNKSYVSVWNEALGSWVAASENTVARGKRSKAKVITAAVALSLVAGYSGIAFGYVANAVPKYGNLVVDNTAAGTVAASTTGAGSIAIGVGASAGGQSGGDYSAIAIGVDAFTNGQATTAIGESASVTGNRSMAIGNSSNVSAENSVALGASTTVTATGSVALGVGSVADQANTVSVGSAASQRRIVNMAAGTVNATSTDAINGSQLYAVSASVAAGLGGGSTVNPDGTLSAPSYRVGGTTVSNMGEAITNLDGRTTENAADITQNTSDIANVRNQLADGSIGLVQQDATSKVITVAKGLDGTTVDFSGTDGARSLSGVKAGALGDTSTEAVNGSQLHATNQNVAANTSSIAANTTNITGLDSRVTTVDNRVTSIDSRVTNVEGSVTNLTQQLDGGSVGLVQQDATSKIITVAKGLDGTTVNFSGTDGARSLSGVKAGALGDTSTEAVNGSQLHATNQNVAANTSSIAANTTNITGLDSRVTTVDNRVTSIDSRVTNVEGSVTNLTQQLDGGSVGLVQQDATSKVITVAKGLDGTTVNFS